MIETTTSSTFVVTLSADTRFLGITESARLLASAVHPPIPGELPIDLALQFQVASDGVHFSEARVSNAQNVALRREATVTFHLAGLQTAVRTGSLTLLSPMTFGPLSIQFEGNGRWQSEVERGLLSVQEFSKYAANYGIGVRVAPKLVALQAAGQVEAVSSSDEEGTQSRRELGKQETAARNRRFVEMAKTIKAERGISNISELARRVEKNLRGKDDWREAKTIQNAITGKV